MAEVDREGNVNVSRFGTKLAGAGGFINISQNARKVIFAGTFTASGLDLRIEDGQLRILQEGRARKFGDRVQQITFSGTLAAKADKTVLYVTERCVFRLTVDGLELIEIAPGVDIERDILAHMAFRPLIGQVRDMDPSVFHSEPLNLRSRLVDLNLTDRIAYDADRNILFLNFEGLHVRSSQDVATLREAVTRKVIEIGKRVAVVVNYDSFRLEDEVAKEYVDSVRDMENTHYTRVSRYTTSAFMRVKLGRELTRTVRPHIFENKAEAQAFHSKA
jgi:propionate CoA-transferase